MPMLQKSNQKAEAAIKQLQDKWEKAKDEGLLPAGVGSKADYDKLIAAVVESTRKNESQAALGERVRGLGAAVVALAKVLKVVT